MTDLKRKLDPIIEHLKAGKKITFFQGAGVSTGAGIPDFRSPKTGLYSNLAKLNLPYAEAVFDIDYFKKNPKAFYTLADELYPGKYQPTSFHYFIRLIQDKGLLHRVYTQNIDTLERVAGVKDEFIVEAHGSFAKNLCIKCKADMSIKDLRDAMDKNEIPTCKKCKAYVKPDIVFFGESLPARFFDLWDEDVDQVEFAIVAGTSLTVYPFASLPTEIDDDVPRVLINKEIVGDFSEQDERDTILLHDCDLIADEICEIMGWKEGLEALKNSEFDFELDSGEEVKRVTEDMAKVIGFKDSQDPNGDNSNDKEDIHKANKDNANNEEDAHNDDNLNETKVSETDDIVNKLNSMKI